MTNGTFRLIQRDVVTPATLVLSAVVGVSGVMLFLHVQPNLVRDAHEWLGLGFVAAAAVHAARHWRSVAGYLQRPLGRLGFAASLVVAGLLLGLTSAPDTGSPQRAAIGHLLQAPLASAAPVLGLTPDEAGRRLAVLGVASVPEQSLAALAQAADRSPIQLLQALIEPSAH